MTTIDRSTWVDLSFSLLRDVYNKNASKSYLSPPSRHLTWPSRFFPSAGDSQSSLQPEALYLPSSLFSWTWYGQIFLSYWWRLYASPATRQALLSRLLELDLCKLISGVVVVVTWAGDSLEGTILWCSCSYSRTRTIFWVGGVSCQGGCQPLSWNVTPDTPTLVLYDRVIKRSATGFIACDEMRSARCEGFSTYSNVGRSFFGGASKNSHVADVLLLLWEVSLYFVSGLAEVCFFQRTVGLRSSPCHWGSFWSVGIVSPTLSCEDL